MGAPPQVTGIIKTMFKMSIKRSYVKALHDIAAAAFSFIISLQLRASSDFIISEHFLIKNLIIFTSVAMVVFVSMRLYQGLWRYASVQDLTAITKATSLTILIFFAINFLIDRAVMLPRSVFIINWLVLLAILGGSRFLYRLIKETNTNDNHHQKINILLIGLNNNSALFLRKKSSEYNVVGIIEEDPKKHGSFLHQVKILGNKQNIKQIYSELKSQNKTPQKLIITHDKPDGALILELLEIADQLGLTIAKLPNLAEFESTSEEVKIKQIVIEDLLGRAQNVLDRNLMSNFITGKIILITGSGGSIGSEIAKQIASFTPSLLILIDNAEYNLYQIHNKLSVEYPKLQVKALLADVRDYKRIQLIFEKYRPQIVFHAAALKHVPLMEDNPCEAVLTNIMGTKNIAELSAKFKAKKMVLISSDKAVNPTNIMGATKRIAECYLEAIAHNETDTRYVTVRFGNVLGSSGSVIPLFENQIKSGGPITITHPEMTRYFMTIREAVELVIEAASIEITEQSALFVLEMGKPIKIKDLAIQMIKMAGLHPLVDIPITYTTIRPGEKLFEELFYASENPTRTSYESILKATFSKVDLGAITRELHHLETQLAFYNEVEVAKLVKELVNIYSK